MAPNHDRIADEIRSLGFDPQYLTPREREEVVERYRDPHRDDHRDPPPPKPDRHRDR